MRHHPCLKVLPLAFLLTAMSIQCCSFALLDQSCLAVLAHAASTSWVCVAHSSDVDKTAADGLRAFSVQLLLHVSATDAALL